jgi:hypothetical protein
MKTTLTKIENMITDISVITTFILYFLFLSIIGKIHLTEAKTILFYYILLPLMLCFIVYFITQLRFRMRKINQEKKKQK